MYFNDFSKMTKILNVIFGPLYRVYMGLQGNHFLKYLKMTKNMTLCTELSQGQKPVDLGVSWKPLSINIFGNFFWSTNKREKLIATPLVARMGSCARVVCFPS